MALKNNYDLFRLFITKEITISDKDKNLVFNINLPVIKDYYINENLNLTFNFWSSSNKDRENFHPLVNLLLKSKEEEPSFLNFITLVVWELGVYKEMMPFAAAIKEGLKFIIPSLKLKEGKFWITEDQELTSEICDYILYLLKLSCGNKASVPLVFTNETDRQFYLAQKEKEEKIAALKAKNNSSENRDALLKAFLCIEYKFPSYTHEYLLNQTMAQIQWLQKYAAGAVSYEVNAEVFAAGNMKKGSKLDFFIK